MMMIAALLCGLLFGCGLVISGMTDPAKVLGFLDIFGSWDPTLAVVMAAALAVAAPGYWLTNKRDQPILAPVARWPERTDIDAPLVAGAVLFGIGWGLVGLCPGPALANLAILSPEIAAFVAAMSVGMVARDFWRKAGLTTHRQ
jgi:uncharacterized membrane protein YedE/YeeE